MAIHSMRWIAYFFALFFLVGCDNSESEEDLELIKEQDKIIRLEFRKLQGRTKSRLHSRNISDDSLNNFLDKYYNFYKIDTNFIYSNKSKQYIKDTFNFDVKSRLDFRLASYNYINSNLAYLKKAPKNNFFIQLNDSVFTKKDTLKINLFWEQEKQTEDSTFKPFETPDDLIQFTTKRNLDYYYQFQFQKDYYKDKTHWRQKELLYPIFYNILIDSTINLKEKYYTLHNLYQETSAHSFYPFEKDTSITKHTPASKEHINLLAYKYYQGFRGNIGIWDRWKWQYNRPKKAKYKNSSLITQDSIITIGTDEYFLIDITYNHLLYNNKPNKNQWSQYTSTPIGQLINDKNKERFIQFDITLNDEYGNPKHYKTNKVPFKIIEQ